MLSACNEDDAVIFKSADVADAVFRIPSLVSGWNAVISYCALLMAKLPALIAIVNVGPPLFAKGESNGSSVLTL